VGPAQGIGLGEQAVHGVVGERGRVAVGVGHRGAVAGGVIGEFRPAAQGVHLGGQASRRVVFEAGDPAQGVGPGDHPAGGVVVHVGSGAVRAAEDLRIRADHGGLAVRGIVRKPGDAVHLIGYSDQVAVQIIFHRPEVPQRIGLPDQVAHAVILEGGDVSQRIRYGGHLRALAAATGTARGVGPGADVGEGGGLAVGIGLAGLPVHDVVGEGGDVAVGIGDGDDVAGPVALVDRFMPEGVVHLRHVSICVVLIMRSEAQWVHYLPQQPVCFVSVMS